MKIYRWVDGPSSVSAIGAPGTAPISRGSTISLTGEQLTFYEARGHVFEEDAPALDDRRERRAKAKPTTEES
ncbi:MAG TPA: hypothetical protein DEU95_06300 [Chloroflexi bacterium]|nr:hypothetical protein [Chloroflexota bacterium]HCG29347.1 hypothetical protein [Chloroflexota bacterium]